MILPLLTFVSSSVQWAQEHLTSRITDGISDILHARASGLAGGGFLVRSVPRHELPGVGHVDQSQCSITPTLTPSFLSPLF